MTITALPPSPARTDLPAAFVAKSDALIAALPLFVSDANTLAAQLNTVAAGGAYSIPYTFDTNTADTDPGNGFLRLSNVVQSAATVLRLDLISSAGADWTNVIDTFDSSGSASKGQIRLVKVGDASKWMTFNVTARTTATGYRNLTVSNGVGSSASPFANGDGLILNFSRTGDIGTTASNTAFTPVAVAASNIDCSLGNYFTDTVAGSKTYTFSNVPAGGFSFTLEAQLDSGSITLPAAVKVTRDQMPTLQTGKTHLFMFVTKNGGTRFRLAVADNYTN